MSTLDDIARAKLEEIRSGGTLRALREITPADARTSAPTLRGGVCDPVRNLDVDDENPRSGARVRIKGQEVLLFAGSNYLDLSHHPRVTRAAAEAVTRWGCAAGGSRLISGNLGIHEALESELARWTGYEAALCFNSGYAANLGIIPALVGPGDLLISDALNHASIIDGARLSGAEVRVYAHANVDALAELLEETREAAGRRLLVLDGVFSMDGDTAPLPDIITLARAHDDVIVMLDDAHGTATLGPDGRGAAAHYGIEDGIDVYLGNLAKALGSFGAFAAGSRLMRELFINVSRSFIFTCALPPGQVAAASSALALAREEPWRRWTLQLNAARMRDRFARAGIATAPSTTHIVPVVIGDNATTMEICEALLARGFYVQGIRHPSVPRGTARLRITPMATHSEAEIDALVDAVLEEMTTRGVGA